MGKARKTFPLQNNIVLTSKEREKSKIRPAPESVIILPRLRARIHTWNGRDIQVQSRHTFSFPIRGFSGDRPWNNRVLGCIYLRVFVFFEHHPWNLAENRSSSRHSSFCSWGSEKAEPTSPLKWGRHPKKKPWQHLRRMSTSSAFLHRSQKSLWLSAWSPSGRQGWESQTLPDRDKNGNSFESSQRLLSGGDKNEPTSKSTPQDEGLDVPCS